MKLPATIARVIAAYTIEQCDEALARPKMATANPEAYKAAIEAIEDRRLALSFVVLAA